MSFHISRATLVKIWSISLSLSVSGLNSSYLSFPLSLVHGTWLGPKSNKVLTSDDGPIAWVDQNMGPYNEKEIIGMYLTQFAFYLNNIDLCVQVVTFLTYLIC